MGGWCDIRDWYDVRNPDLDPIVANNKNLPLSWLEATAKHKMPVIKKGLTYLVTNILRRIRKILRSNRAI